MQFGLVTVLYTPKCHNHNALFHKLAARDREEPIAVKNFESHVQQMHAGRNFETEYMVCAYTTFV